MLFVVPACKPSIVGDYVSDQSHMRIAEDHGALVLEVRDNAFELKKGLRTFPLKQAGESYEADVMGGFANLTIVRSDRGISSLIGGNKEDLAKVDVARGAAHFDEEGARRIVGEKISRTLKSLADRSSCGDYGQKQSERRAAHLSNALSRAEVDVKVGDPTQGVTRDRYVVDGTIFLPATETTHADQKYCVRYEQVFFSRECVAWKKATLVVRRPAYQIPFSINVDQTRFRLDGLTERVRFVKFGDREEFDPDALCGLRTKGVTWAEEPAAAAATE